MAKRSLMTLLLCLVLVIATVGMAAANGPELMVYSGAIPQGANQGDGTYEISFSIYASEQGGSVLWTEKQNVYVYQGTFAVYLGAAQKLNLAFDMPYWVGVKAGDKEDVWPLTGAGYPMAVDGGVASSTGTLATSPGTGAPSLAVAADTVLSASIKEADGTTGQNTNSGSGIKTGHIQNGAVTDAKISGKISGSKISSTGLNADKLDGLDSTAFVKKSGATMTGALNLPANGLVAGTNQLVLSSGKVGIGTANPGQKLSVAGTIESTTGGIKFPDDTIQTTASKPTWSQIIAGAGRWKSVLGGTAALDKETGLVWQRATDGVTKTYNAAMTYCYQLGLGGRRGWRPPTVEELSSLVDTSVENPSLPSGHPFTDASDILLSYYWSSTTDPSFPNSAWVVEFQIGGGGSYNKDGSAPYVRCVRGGQ